jgi:hypothetical protein
MEERQQQAGPVGPAKKATIDYELREDIEAIAAAVGDALNVEEAREDWNLYGEGSTTDFGEVRVFVTTHSGRQFKVTIA